MNDLLSLPLLSKEFAGNTLFDWMIALAIAFVVVVILYTAIGLVRRYALSRSVDSETDWSDIVFATASNTKTYLSFIFGLFIGSLYLEFPTKLENFIWGILIVSILLQIGLWGTAFIKNYFQSLKEKASKKNSGATTSINLISLAAKFALWSTIVLLALDNLGVNVTGLIAGLGIGGVAIALAVQNILGDLFASLSILLDKPFAVGDFIIIDSHMGSVEHIGLKTTRIRSLSGEQLVFSNSDLLKSRIRNYGRMRERRVVFSIGVTYDTPRSKLEKIPELIKTSICSQDKTRFDRSHFMQYGDYALLFETVYYVNAADYNLYMDIQQSINLAIHEQFECEKIEFAYPTQKLLVSRY